MDMSFSLTPFTFSPSAAKFAAGSAIPNRIFVGGIANDTTEIELKHFFSGLGAVRDCKIILDRAGLSKSYGFVTFESQEDAENVLKRAQEKDSITLRDRKLNIGRAYRKQVSSRALAEQSMPPPPGPAVLYSNGTCGVPYSLPNGVTVYCSADGSSYLIPAQQQPSGVGAAMFHQPVMSSYCSSPNYYSQSPTTIPTPWQSPGQWRWPSPSVQAASLIAPPAGQFIYPMHHSNAMVMPSDVIYSHTNQAFHTAEAIDQ